MDDLRHDVWSSREWHTEVRAWITVVLTADGRQIAGPIEQPRIRPWSTQLIVPTTAGRMWFKQNCPALIHEASLVAVLGELVPDQVVVPYAVEPDRGWLLSPDAGPTLATLDTADEPTWARILQEYADLQRRLASHATPILATGVPALPPTAAGAWAAGHAHELAARPAVDPRHLDPDEVAAVLATVVRLEAAATELDGSAVPLSLEHNDLHANNVFIPTPGSRLRFFDLGDAVWAHPFTSLWLAVRIIAHEWGVAESDARIARLVDAYLEVWSDLAPAAELRRLHHAARAFGPVHRTFTWARCLDSTDPASWHPDLLAADTEWMRRLPGIED